MEIYEKIKKRRLELGLTLDDVAKFVGVSKATVSRWESGEITNMRRDRIANLAKILKVQPNFIMGISEVDSRIDKLNKREKNQLEEVLNSANLFFNDENYDDETKQKVLLSLQELFFDAKAKNKRKK